MRARWWCALVAVLALAAGCGDDDGGTTSGGDGPEETSGMDVTEALEDLRALIEGTAGAVATTGEAEVLTDLGPAPCQSSQTGAVTDEESATLTVALPVEAGAEAAVLEEVAAFWEGEGLEVDTERLDGPEPEVLGRGGAFGVSAIGMPGTGQVSVMGATDCLEAAGG